MMRNTKKYPSRIDSFINNHEKLLIIFLCAVAAVRIFIFAGAFPFFCNVDEAAHFDTVFKYARGYLPTNEDIFFDGEAARIIVLYNTDEYTGTKPYSKTGAPLISLIHVREARPFIDKIIYGQESFVNFESHSPPVYYMITGLWYKIGKFLSLKEPASLYWIRFFNIFVVALLVGFSYIFVKKFFPDDKFLRLSLPLMVAFIPQDVFYSINSDVLSPLLFTVSLYFLFDLYFSDSKSYLYCFFAGIFIALTLLTKFSNVALMGAAAVVLSLKVKQLYQKRTLREINKIKFLIIVAVFPFLFWIGRNYILLDDILGSKLVTEVLGWSAKPFNEIFRHPIFSLNGIIIFWSEFMKSFWRGEFTWHLVRLAGKRMDLFYAMSSFVFISITALNSYIFRKHMKSNEKFIIAVCFLVFLLFVCFLIIASIVFDFGTCWYPSKEYPYCTSGRLILGTLVPFLILYLKGLHIILQKLKRVIHPVVVVLIIALLITSSEISITKNIFKDPYNFFNHGHSYPDAPITSV